MSLSQYFHKIGANPPIEESVTTAITTSPTASMMPVSEESSSHYTTVMSVCRDVWLHWAFLGRDLLIQHPLLVAADAGGSAIPITSSSSSSSTVKSQQSTTTSSSSSSLSALCGAILIADGVDLSNGAGHSGGSSNSGLFPSAAECLFVMVFTGVIGSLTASTSVPSTHSLKDDRLIDFKIHSSSGMEKDGHMSDHSNDHSNDQSEVIQGLREDQNRLRIRQCLQGDISSTTTTP